MTLDQPAWTPPAGPAWGHAPTRSAFRRWRTARLVDLAAVVGAFLLLLGALALLATGIVVGRGWAVGVGAGGLLASLTLVIRALRRDLHGLARTRELRRALITRPWLPYDARLARHVEVPDALGEGGGLDVEDVRWILADAVAGTSAVLDTAEDDAVLRTAAEQGAPLWCCTAGDDPDADFVVFVPTRSGGRLYPARPGRPPDPTRKATTPPPPTHLPAHVTALDLPFARRAWRRWYVDHVVAAGVTVLLVGGAAVGVVLLSRAGTTGLAGITTIAVVGPVVLLAQVRESGVLDLRHARRTRRRLEAGAWVPFGGVVVRHAREVPTDEGGTHRGLRVWLEDDGVTAWVKTGHEPPGLRAAVQDGGALWTCGRPSQGPAVLVRDDGDRWLVLPTSVLRTDGDRNRCLWWGRTGWRIEVDRSPGRGGPAPS